MKNVRILLIAGGALLVGISVFLLGLQAFGDEQQFKGSAIGTPAPQAMDFELQQPDGRSFRLEEQRGKVVLIYLGYTNCPDVCPATMGKYQQIAEELGEDASNVVFVLITVDPDRDTGEVLATYMDRFNLDFVGLTGPLEELQRVWVGYGAGTPYHQEVDSEIGYTVEHSTRVWVIDKEGNLRITFPFEMTASDMAHDVKLLLVE
ncbi:MAG TPA: SCO family protein [Anaerolineales bacterium]|nr:SCO family protein [Anaerolineales bacterium]